jgi:hypothetical protein
METRAPSRLAWTLLALLPACGGGGGSSGPSVTGRGFAPNTGPGDVEHYFPDAVGNEWSLNYTASADGAGSVTGITTLSITEPLVVHGESATVLRQSDSRSAGVLDSYYSMRPGGITYLGDDDPADTITPYLVPQPFLLFPAGVGEVSTVTGRHLPFGTDQLGNPLWLETTQTCAVAQFEPLDLFCGSYPAALKHVTTMSGSVTDAALHITIPISSTETIWFAPGAGIVKHETSITVDTITTGSSAETRGYKVDGARHGVGKTETAFEHLVPDDFVTPPEGVPALAGDGTNFLVAARKVIGSSGQYLSRWVVQRISADGSLVGGSVDLGPPLPVYDAFNQRKAAVVFDGVEYIVVYEQDEPSPDWYYRVSLMAVRVSTEGVVLGPPEVVAASSDAQKMALEPALAFDGTRCLLCFVRTYGVFLSPSTGAADGPEFPIGVLGPAQSTPALAFDGAHYLAVWNQQPWWDATGGLVGARVGVDGTVLDPAWIQVCAAQTDPAALACDGGNFLVLWTDHRAQPGGLFSNVYGNRIAPNGQLLDGDAQTGGFAVTSSVGRAEVNLALGRFDGGYLAVWLSSSSPGVYEGLYGRRLSSAGQPLGPGEGTLLTYWGFQTHVSLAAGSQSSLLTWMDETGTTAAQHVVRTVGLHPRAP